MWVIWRVVFEKIASLQEIETFWSIDDLMEANDIIDYKNSLQAVELQNLRKSSL